MRAPLLMDIYSRREIHKIPMESFYRFYKITRQGFKHGSSQLQRINMLMSEIELMVADYRKRKDRRAGSRSLYHNLGIKSKFKIGVNKFERLLSDYGFTLVPLRINVVTTKSIFQSWNYKNLCKGLVITGINQLVVGDLTYLSLGKERYFFFCLIDVFSAKIVGCKLSKRMRKQEALASFNQWIELRGAHNVEGCIHHTDGGSQYFSVLYLNKMNEHNLKISVAKNCLENGYAEQRNSVIKYHLIPTIQSSKQRNLEKQIKEMICFYNNERKQEALGWRSPNELEEAIHNKRLDMKLTLHNHDTKKASKRLGFRRH